MDEIEENKMRGASHDEHASGGNTCKVNNINYVILKNENLKDMEVHQ